MRRLLIAIVILAALGVGVSAYALWQHYAPLGSAFCNLGETFSCDLVNKSAFSEVFGIPVALIGILGYVGIGALAVVAYSMVSPPLPGGERLVPRSSKSEVGEWVRGQVSNVKCQTLMRLLLIASLAGLAFSLYLTYLEFFVIGAICVLCVTSQALILAITVLTTAVWQRSWNV